MELKTKFSIGDKVKVMAEPIIKTTCPFCYGKGRLSVNGTFIYCQNCNDGVLENVVSEKRQLVEGIITGINFEVKSWIPADSDNYEDEGYKVLMNEGVVIREDYYVEVDKEQYKGYGTYPVENIRELSSEEEI